MTLAGMGGGGYPKRDIDWTSTSGTIEWVQLSSVSIHDCPQPDPDTTDLAEWTCPECTRTYHLRTESWWEPNN